MVSQWLSLVKKRVQAAHQRSKTSHACRSKECLTVKVAMDKLKKQKYRCALCKKRMDCKSGSPKVASIDRLANKCIYGRNNFRWTCFKCNHHLRGCFMPTPFPEYTSLQECRRAYGPRCTYLGALYANRPT